MISGVGVGAETSRGRTRENGTGTLRHVATAVVFQNENLGVVLAEARDPASVRLRERRARRREVSRGLVQHQHPVEPLPCARRRELLRTAAAILAGRGGGARAGIIPPRAHLSSANDTEVNPEASLNRSVD